MQEAYLAVLTAGVFCLQKRSIQNESKKEASQYFAAELLGHQRVLVPVVLYNPSSDCSSHMHANEKSVWHMPPAALLLMTNSAGMQLMCPNYLL